MAKTNDNILEKARKRGIAVPSAGMKVPDGYFDDFCARMEQMLPERPEIEVRGFDGQSSSKSLWQSVRTYVYMAAMFAGVWCMLQMFASLGGAGKLQPMSDNPVLAKALASDDFMKDYIYDDLNSWEIVDEMMEDGTLVDDTAFEALLDDEPAPAETESGYVLPM